MHRPPEGINNHEREWLRHDFISITGKLKAMLGSLDYYNPTKLYFGDDAQKNLSEELKNYGTKVLLTYGGGSIKTNSIYDEAAAALRAAD